MGILGGSFNPPHIGHLVLAQEAAAQLGLDEVLLVPAGEAPHKRIDPEPGRQARLELVRRAVEGSDLLSASDVEVGRNGPSYTYETLELLAQDRPGDELWFLMGADVAAGFERWREPRRIAELARLGVAARGGTAQGEAEQALEAVGAGERSQMVEMPEIGISSSWVRRRVANGRPIRYVVPDAVAELIAAQGLYR